MVPRREGHTLRAPLLVPEVASFEDEDPLDVEAGDPGRRSSLDDDTARANSGDSASPSSDDTDALWPQPAVPSHRNPGLETLDYEPVHNDVLHEIFADDRWNRSLTKHFYGYTGLTLAKYALTIIVGVCTGLCAAFIDFLVDEVYALKQWLILENFSKDPSNASDEAAHRSAHYVAEYVTGYTALCLALVLGAASLCLFWAPQAQGGGVTSVMAYLNGTAIPGLLSWKSLVAKIFGVAAACGSSLAVGPEGPMVHVGAAMASVVTLAMPRTWLGEVRGGEAYTDDDDDAGDDSDAGGERRGHAKASRAARAPVEEDEDEDLFDAIDDAASLEESRRRGDLLAGRVTGINNASGDDESAGPSGVSRNGHNGRRRGRRLSRGGSSAFSTHNTRNGAAGDDNSTARRFTRRSTQLSRLLLDLASNATQREFVSAGAAAGLAAAFGAPIGGVLFSLEEASSYWSRKVMWRSFVCAAAATIVLALCMERGNAGMLFFGGVRPVQPRDYLHQLPFFVVAAAAAGVCGVVFNQLSHVLAAHVRPRNAAIRSRLVECAVVSVTTVALRFFAAQRFGSCVDASPAWEADDFGVRFLCPPGKVNDVATAFFSSPNKAIGWMLSMGEHAWGEPYGFTPAGLGACCGFYLVMMIAAYGTAVPGGIFMPSIFLGACGGGALGLCFRELLPESWDIQPGLYALIGATAMLGGVFRSSISLVVIMVEGTGGITFVFCIIVAVVVSNAVSSWLQKHGVYHMDLHRNDNVAYLSGEPPRKLALLTAKDLMASPVSCVAETERRSRALTLLTETSHNGFPVVDPRGRLVGMCLRSQLSVLIHGDKHARPGSHPGVRRALDTYMRVAHLRRRPMPRPLLPRRYPPATALSAAALAEYDREMSRRERETSGRDGGRKQSPGEDRVGLLLNDAFAAMQGEGGGRAAYDDEEPSEEDERPLSPPLEKARDSGGFGSEFGGSARGSAPLSQTAQLEQDSESNAHGSTSASESVDGGVPSRPASRGGVERQQSRFAQFQAEVAAAGAAPPGGGQFPSHHASYRPPVFELGQIRDSSNEDDDETLDDEGAAGLDVASFMHRAPLAVQADFPATRVYSVFTTLALRHLTVTDAGNRVLGIITRKDVMAAVDGAH